VLSFQLYQSGRMCGVGVFGYKCLRTTALWGIHYLETTISREKGGVDELAVVLEGA
jgi:hypothetical protein